MTRHRCRSLPRTWRPSARVRHPRLRPGALRVGIVHFGVGGFHRAHQAMYLDRLMNEGKALDWAICGVGSSPGRAWRDVADSAGRALHAGGEARRRHAGAPRHRIDHRVPLRPRRPGGRDRADGDPATRIVSLTVTEGGYNFHAVTGRFDEDDPAFAHDLQPGPSPRTSFGLVTEALVRRRDRGSRRSPSLLRQHPGQRRRGAAQLLGLRRDAGPRAGRLGPQRGRFPNSMVDRITPVTTDEDRARAGRRFGVEDGWPVVCEPFTQWVLEEFATAAALEDAGVQVVEDVEPYELMKLRLLNASHQALAYFGYLAGYRLVHEACHDPLFADFLLAYMDDEATPTLRTRPRHRPRRLQARAINRFSNPQVRDTLARLCAESSDRIPKWLLPVIRHNLARGGEVDCRGDRRELGALRGGHRRGRRADRRRRPEEGHPDGRRPGATDRPAGLRPNREIFGDLADESASPPPTSQPWTRCTAKAPAQPCRTSWADASSESRGVR